MILGVIPARGGSKGLKRKNAQKLCGKPLIWWSIKAAEESQLLDRFVVSTEDPEIEAISKKEKAKVVKRPKYLAVDTAIITNVMKHVLQKIRADIVVWLTPTSPIRINNIIDQAIERFLKTGADTLATGFMSTSYEWGTLPEKPRQNMDDWFCFDGTVYVTKAEVFLNDKFFGDKLEKMVIPRVYNYDIDYKEDLWAIEGIMKNIGIRNEPD